MAVTNPNWKPVRPCEVVGIYLRKGWNMRQPGHGDFDPRRRNYRQDRDTDSDRDGRSNPDTKSAIRGIVDGSVRRTVSYTHLDVYKRQVQTGLLGALLTFAGRPLYAAHLSTTAAWGLTPLEDQQLAGLIMWIPASLIHLTTLGVLFVVWMHTAERQVITASAARPSTMLRDPVR